jgi:hypothetical protein
MTVEHRDANIIFVSFNARPPAATCATCPFRRCCSCAHWLPETRTCMLGAKPEAAPRTDEDDWCGRWEPRAISLAVENG